MLRLLLSLFSLALIPTLATANICALPFAEQINNRQVQEFLIASGYLNSEVGHSVDAELRRAVRWLRQGSSTAADAALTSAECDLVGQRIKEFHDFARLVPRQLEHSELTVLYPEAIGPGVSSSQRFQTMQAKESWIDHDEPDWSFGIDVFKSSLFRDTPLTLQSGTLGYWRNVTLHYIQSAHDEAVIEGVGDFTHRGSPPSTVRYFFHNLSFEHRGAVKGLYLKYSVRPPNWFNKTPTFLKGALAIPELVTTITADFGISDEREVAWLLFVQSVTNIVVSHFKSNNGWVELTIANTSGPANCSAKPEAKMPGVRPVRVIFGTTRKPTDPFVEAVMKGSASGASTTLDAENLFSTEPDKRLHFGCAVMSATRPSTILPPRSWASYFRRPNPSPVAKLDSVTRYRGHVYLFSWPSGQSYFRYLSDLERAKAAQPALLGFLRAILQDRNVRYVDIVAHSAGTEQLLSTLERMLPTFDKRTPDPTQIDKPDSKRLRLGQVILAAPDVDSQVFQDKVAALAPFAERVTVYISEADLALRISRSFRSGQQRAGNFRRGESPVKVRSLSRDSHVHVIDITGSRPSIAGIFLRPGFGHDDFMAVQQVNKDIALVLGGRSPKGIPTARGATAAGNVFCPVAYAADGSDIYWAMREASADKLGPCPNAMTTAAQ